MIVVTGGNGCVARELVKNMFIDPTYATALIGSAAEAIGGDILHDAIEVHVVSRTLDEGYAEELR